MAPNCVGLGLSLPLIWPDENQIREWVMVMSDKNCGAALQMHDLLAAMSLLTRIPVPVDHDRAGQRAANAVWAYPVVGAFLGLIGGLVGGALVALGVNGGIAAAAVIGVAVLLTGALHEDGVADCADGLGGGMTRERRMEIMKDSRIGAFGAVALMVVILARWSGTQALLPQYWPVIFAVTGAASRLPMVLAMSMLPLASSAGMAARVGRPPMVSVALSIVLTAGISIALLGGSGAVILGIACLAPVPLWWLARSKIGGYTGDILGASQQLAEIAALAAATALL